MSCRHHRPQRARRRVLALAISGLALAATLAATLAVGTAGCLSPTLPLPPPEAPDGVGESPQAGVWEIRGGCTPGAVVLIKNADTGVIAGTEDKDHDGRYFVRLEAQQCHTGELYEIVDTTTSDSTFFIIEPTSGGISESVCE